MASRSLHFEQAFKKIDEDLYEKLVKYELTTPHLFKTFFEGAPGTPTLQEECQQLARDVGGDRRWWANGHRQYTNYIFLPEKLPEALPSEPGQWTATP